MTVARLQRAEARDRLVDGAIALMAEKTFASVTVEDLANRAGIGFWSTYRALPTRDQIFRMATLRLARRALDGFSPNSASGSVVDAIRTFTTELVNRMTEQDYPLLLAVLVRESNANEWLKEMYEDEIVRPVSRALENVVRGAGERLGTIVLLQPDASRQFIMQLEAALVLPRLHPLQPVVTDADKMRAINAAVAQVTSQAYACDWDGAVAA